MTSSSHTRDLYIDLLQKALTGRLQAQKKIRFPTKSELGEVNVILQKLRAQFSHYLPKGPNPPKTFLDSSPLEIFYILEQMKPDRQVYSMTEASGVENVTACTKQVLEQGIPGDFIETGVWKGGLTMLMKGILKAYGDTQRKVWVADSFEGLPQPDPTKDLNDAITHALLQEIDSLSISKQEVQENFARFDLLDERVEFLEGWFKDTLPEAPFEQVALCRLDGDWYDSTMDAITNLYPRLSDGGFIIIDDYGLPIGCKKAVDEYRAEHNITEPIQWVNQQTVYWQKAG